MRPLLLNLNSQESNPQHNEKPEDLTQIQLSADIQEKSKSTLVEEDSQTVEPETSPLWSMNLMGPTLGAMVVQGSRYATSKTTTQKAFPQD